MQWRGEGVDVLCGHGVNAVWGEGTSSVSDKA